MARTPAKCSSSGSTTTAVTRALALSGAALENHCESGSFGDGGVYDSGGPGAGPQGGAGVENRRGLWQDYDVVELSRAGGAAGVYLHAVRALPASVQRLRAARARARRQTASGRGGLQ